MFKYRKSSSAFAIASLMATAVFAPTLPACAQPDLVTTNLPVASTVVANSSFYVTNIIANTGDAPADFNSWVGFLLSTNPVLERTNLWLDIDRVINSRLAAGERQTNIYQVFLPNLPAGTYYLAALADADGDEEDEANWSNNFSTAQSLQVVHAIDLMMTEVHTLPIWTNGFNTPMGCVVTNLGSVNPAKRFIIGFYVSTDPIITTDDLWVGEYETHFEAGNVVNFGILELVPEDLAPGIYYFGAIVDPWNQIADFNETNNTTVGIPFESRDPHPILTQLHVIGTNVVVSFSTVPWRDYALEWTASLVPPILWQTVTGAGSIPGADGDVRVTDPAGLARGQRFYRVRRLPLP